MKRILILVGISLLLCSTASAFQGGAGESTKKNANPTKTSVTKPDKKEKQGLPQFLTGTPYRNVRTKLMKLGWQPVTLPSATPCGDDDRCRGFPEVYFCSGVGSATHLHVEQEDHIDPGLRRKGVRSDLCRLETVPTTSDPV